MKPKFKVGDVVTLNSDYENDPPHRILGVYKNTEGHEYLYNLSGIGCSFGCLIGEDRITKVK